MHKIKVYSYKMKINNKIEVIYSLTKYSITTFSVGFKIYNYLYDKSTPLSAY